LNLSFLYPYFSTLCQRM